MIQSGGIGSGNAGQTSTDGGSSSEGPSATDQPENSQNAGESACDEDEEDWEMNIGEIMIVSPLTTVFEHPKSSSSLKLPYLSS